MKHGFFVLFNQQTQSLFTNSVFSLYVSSHMHLQTRCASSNDFSVLMVPIQCLFWFIHSGFFFTLFTKSIGFVSFSSPMQHSHIHTVFKHYHEQDAMIEKQKFVQCHWLEKIGEKSRMKWKKLSCAVTYNEGGRVEAGIGPSQKNSCESEYWKYWRKLRFLGHRPDSVPYIAQ